MDRLREGSVRNHLGQFAGWIIVLGHEEYGSKQDNWKVGAYEPTIGIHGDIEYLYTINLEDKTLTYTSYTDDEIEQIYSRRV